MIWEATQMYAGKPMRTVYKIENSMVNALRFNRIVLTKNGESVLSHWPQTVFSSLPAFYGNLFLTFMQILVKLHFMQIFVNHRFSDVL